MFESRSRLLESPAEPLSPAAMKVFWARCPVTKAIIDAGGVYRDDNLRTKMVFESQSLPDENGIYSLYGIPLPFTHVDVGNDDLQEEAGARRVSEKLEEMVILGGRLEDRDHTSIYGLCSRNVLRVGSALQAVKTMLDSKFFGPYVMVTKEGKFPLVPLKIDYNDREVEIEIKNVCTDIELPEGDALLFQNTPHVVRIIIAQEPLKVKEWHDGKTKVAHIMVPQVRTLFNGDVGVIRIRRGGISE